MICWTHSLEAFGCRREGAKVRRFEQSVQSNFILFVSVFRDSSLEVRVC